MLIIHDPTVNPRQKKDLEEMIISLQGLFCCFLIIDQQQTPLRK